MKTPERIRDEIIGDVLVYAANEGLSPLGAVQAGIRMGIEADRAEREPEFEHPDFPDKYRDLWEENMPRVSGCMYFAIPGEQPIHVTDEEAKHILAYLSEKNR